MAQIQATFGRECLPLNLPADGGARVVDCFYTRQGEGSTDFSSVEQAHRALVEQVVEVDAAFVERYLNDGDIDPQELHAPLEQALREGHLIPICFVSARTGAGVPELLDVIARLLPDPSEGNPPAFLKGEGADAKPLKAEPDASLHVLAHVFKVTQDPYVGKMGVLRVHQGTLTTGLQLYVGDARRPFKVGHLLRLQGKEYIEVPRAYPGDICAIAKIEELHFDAVLHDSPDDDHIHLKPLEFPVPVHGLAIEPKRRGDEQRLHDILQKLVSEDPCLRLEHVVATNDSVVYGLGELHLRTLLDRLTEVHRCEVTTRPPRIAYRETITAPAEGHHRHKKQTGGAGQFGEVFLRDRATAARQRLRVRGPGQGRRHSLQLHAGRREGRADGPRGRRGGRLSGGRPARDRLRRQASHGGQQGDRVHPAGKKAVQAAVQAARPSVLEPIVNVEITAPEQNIGDITGDLASRRAQVSGTTSASGALAVVAQAPLAELSSYQSRLNALTGGQGRYTLAFSHYEQVPPNGAGPAGLAVPGERRGLKAGRGPAARSYSCTEASPIPSKRTSTRSPGVVGNMPHQLPVVTTVPAGTLAPLRVTWRSHPASGAAGSPSGWRAAPLDQRLATDPHRAHLSRPVARGERHPLAQHEGAVGLQVGQLEERGHLAGPARIDELDRHGHGVDPASSHLHPSWRLPAPA